MRLLFILTFVISLPAAQAQVPFEIQLESDSIPGLPGLHSYAFGTDNGKWIIIGGRTNGLHGFQPPNAFPYSGQNTRVYVVDPIAETVHSSDLSVLNAGIFEQVISGNMQFIQRDTVLYFFGGYGYSVTAGDHMTYPGVVAINLPQLVTAVQSNQPIVTAFRQLTDQRFAVTGGHICAFGDTMALVFGHRFDGRYNPNNGPSFVQQYTEEIRRFTLNDNGSTLTVGSYQAQLDTANFHRRDYNLAPIIDSNGNIVYMGYTGVFRKDIDFPFLNSVGVTASGSYVDNSFQQLLNQYHTANVGIYDSIQRVSHNVFFGGMGFAYYDMNNVLIYDSLVPFVQTISVMSHALSGTTESVLPIRMPGYLGSAAEFIAVDNIAMRADGILDLQQLDTGRVLIGYIFGGIESNLPNIFMQATGTSWASNEIHRVYLRNTGPSSINYVNQVVTTLSIFPSPSSDKTNIVLTLKKDAVVKVCIYDLQGRIVSTVYQGERTQGTHMLHFNAAAYESGNYLLVVNANGIIATQRFSVTR
jgi:hypothetical protein